MKIIKWDRRKFMKYFGDNDYDYDNIEDIIIVEDGERDRDFPFSVYVRMKGELQYTSFASGEFSIEELIKMYEEDD